MLETLIKLGLSDKEARVYLAALELGEATAQQLAEKSKVNRATTYVILERLMSLGLASSVERGKKTMFVAEDPRELANIFAEQQREIESRRQLLGEAMGELQAVYNANLDKPIVRFFEGKEGLEALDRYGYDMAKPDTEYLGIMPLDIVEDAFPERRKAAVDERVKHKLRSKVIYTHRDGPKLTDEEENKKQLREAVFLSRDEFPITGSVLIYPNWGVKFFDFQAGREVGVLIQSPAVANNLRELFKLAWKNRQDT